MEKVGLIYHPKIAAAETVAEELSEFLTSKKVTAWMCSSWDETEIGHHVTGTDLAVSVGGDGTILRVARAVTPMEIPILGVNLGHLGFMTELSADEITKTIPSVLDGEGWIDRRTMLQVEVRSNTQSGSSDNTSGPFYALNDVILGRRAVSRVVYVEATVNGERLTTYKADGVIVSTATGSTGYSLAAGGPILYPQADEILIKPVSAHLTMAYALVLPPTSVVELTVRTDHEAILSIDGQIELRLHDGDTIAVQRSPYSARFLRIHPPTYFYSMLEQRLRGRGSN